jgi:hypothetical protein
VTGPAPPSTRGEGGGSHPRRRRQRRADAGGARAVARGGVSLARGGVQVARGGVSSGRGARDLDGHGAVEVRAAHGGPGRLQDREGVGVGVAVGVVRTHRDERHGGGRPAEEVGVARAGAVVRHGEQIDAQRVGFPGGDRAVGEVEQVGLGRQLGVAGEQRGPPVVDGADDQGTLVHLAVGVAVGPARWWPEHLEPDVTHRGRHPFAGWAHHLADRDAGLGRGPVDGVDGRRGLR